MKLLVFTLMLYLFSFSGRSHANDWRSCNFVSSTLITLESENDLFDFEKLKNSNKLQRLETIKATSDLSNDIVDESPAVEVAYAKLKKLNFDGDLKEIEPEKVSQQQVMMELSEFQIFQSSDEEITISLDYLSDQKINIFDSEGKLAASVIVSNLEKAFIEVNISNFDVGVYTASDGQTTIEFEKE